MFLFFVAAAAWSAASASVGVRGGQQSLAADDSLSLGSVSLQALECDAATGLPKDVTPHPNYAKIQGAVKNAVQMTQIWDENMALFRVQDAEWPRIPELINGMGAYYAGARWGPKCLAQTYLSRDDVTALQECKAASAKLDRPVLQTYPRLIVSMYFTGKKYLDLTGDRLSKLAVACGVPADTADKEDWSEIQKSNKESFTQAVGRALAAEGVRALLVTSKANPTGQNLIVFPGPNPESLLAVDDQDRLKFMIKVGTMTEAQIAEARGKPEAEPPDFAVGYPDKTADGRMKWTNNPMLCKPPQHCNPK